MSSSASAPSSSSSPAVAVAAALASAALSVGMAMRWAARAASAPAAPLQPSITSMRTVNPIRGVVERIDRTGNPEKEHIVLALGDPTKFGNFAPPPSASALLTNFEAKSHNGYTHSAGAPDARAAIAAAYSYPDVGNELRPNDVVIASGASGAIYLAIQALCNEGDEILVPSPGFALYGTAARSCGVVDVEYPLDPDNSWLVKLDALEARITPRTRAIVINNPSNPCGSVFPREHLEDILDLAAKYNLPIIADEIYHGMVFKGVESLALAQLRPRVPIFAISGLAKRFMVPGWRVGWICVYDYQGRAEPIRRALYQLAQITLGANTLVQSVIPALLTETPTEYHEANNAKLEANARIVLDALASVAGIACTVPEGAMYTMARIDFDAFDDSITTDMHFVQGLLDEESVFALPGSCFNAPNFFRIVFAPPPEQLKEACARIAAFCARHAAAK
ncbi:tyrosine aminotransferase [Thecamonas trahens ATCC 50062]|uniref:Tyrosine aminotransferase n=1 Tax=Thecamonas trahens ATCC 50062 TaxID=461836 RepID=A0A0L0DA25_THETB|nr:tyrosine aminotransferase [Thecamonas trahens ATCC 50062]KNC49070.1 tyrosine aminotransferase [Thecamonas trahens ATCC 50062]|eukprot:XP_013758101.1 tyrosine aminotransferase [Thecamonas trahens ATCC 50062]